MKKSALRAILNALIIIGSISVVLYSNTVNTVLTVPLIPIQLDETDPSISRDSLSLKINGIPRSIYNLKKVEKSLDNIQDMGRDIVLSFMTSKACGKLLRGISYFITDVVQKEDSLIIVTPLNAYQMKPGNKERIIEGIGKILDRDCKRFCHNKALFEKRIMSELKKIETIISSGKSFYNNTRHIKVLFRFLNSFPEELDQYIRLTLLKNFEKFEGVTDQILDGENEKWWIHFSNDDSHKVVAGVKRILKLIGSSSPSLSLNDAGIRSSNPVLQNELESRGADKSPDSDIRVTFSRFIKVIRKSLDVKERMMVKDIGDRIRGAGICFNSINFNPRVLSGDGSKNAAHSAAKSVFDDLSNGTGGRIFFEDDIENALKEIARHRITLYHLDFPLLKKDNGITIHLDDKHSILRGFSYPRVLSGEFVGKVRRNLSRRKCRISDLKVRNDRISFCVTGFEKNMKKTGLLKVGVSVCGRDGQIIYDRKNTLLSNPGSNQVSLSIRIPVAGTQECDISITVIDVIARKRSQVNREVTLSSVPSS